jgi:demethylmenaquinone methyltransferase/2-methoxy-6-polyprenyl-1,4-benzoquinol methylase
MANEFYQPGEERAAKVHALFARIAPRYDLINDLQSFGLHRHWKRRVVELARPQPGMKALDVCCGTGDLAIALAQHGAEVVGLDFNERMLSIARERAARSRRASPVHSVAPAFVIGDALQLPFAQNSFDIVTVGYGLRNLAHWRKGLAEMNRVARPGGRVLVLDFGKPPNRAWRNVYFGYLRLFVPALGLMFCHSASAYAYILESLKHYPAQTGLAAAMAELQMQDVRVINFMGGVMSINYGEKAA